MKTSRTIIKLVAFGLPALIFTVASVIVSAPARSQPAQIPAVYAFGFLGFNTRTQPFSNPDARRAAMVAIDRNKVARYEFEATATGIIPPGCIGYNRKAQIPSPAPQHAAEILTRAGVRPSDLGDLVLWVGPGRSTETANQVLADSLRAIGLRVTINKERAQIDTARRVIAVSGMHMFYISLLTDACRRLTVLEQTVHSKGMANFSGYGNSEIDALIDRARGATDPATRDQTYAAAEQRALDEAALIPLWWGGLPERIYRTTVQAADRGITIRISEVALLEYSARVNVTIENGTDVEVVLTGMHLDARLVDEWGNTAQVELSTSTLPDRIAARGSATGVLQFNMRRGQTTRKLLLTLPRIGVGEQAVVFEFDISPP